MISSSLDRARRFQQRYAPFLALGIGCLARALSHRGVEFAPKAVALLALGWTLPVALARFDPAAASSSSSPSSSRPSPAPSWRARLARFAATTLVIALYRNVLFFLVPIWFGSATVSSINILFPLVLAGMALFSCFDRAYHAQILERPVIRVIWTSTILFAALVPAVAVVASLSPRWAAAVAAAVALSVTIAALAPRDRLRSRRVRLRLVCAAAGGAAFLSLVAPILPPAPIVCHHAAAGTGVRDRAIEGAATRFAAGTPRLYAWFAVTLPSVYRQGINFQWYRDGQPAGRPVASSVVGGRKDGFRTWSSLGAPAPGRWRVDLLTDSGQLICRQSALVEPRR